MPIDSDHSLAVALGEVDGDGDLDVVIGNSGSGGVQNRLYANDGAGSFADVTSTRLPAFLDATNALALGDVDGDGRMDVVQAQGEVEGAEQERIYLGTGLEPDRAAPSVSIGGGESIDGGRLVRARVHDRKSPTLATEWRSVEVRWEGGGTIGMTWYGEYLWRAVVPAEARNLSICATDASGNEACVPVPGS
jgi:hypothetical protein